MDICNVVFAFRDCVHGFKNIKQHGLRIVEDVTELTDESGSVLSATICGSAGSIVHTLIEQISYDGIFLPGWTV